MSIKVACLVVALAASPLLARGAIAGPIRNLSPAQCITDKGSEFEIPPGVHMDLSLWARLDIETKRLQEVEVRLSAENKSLKEQFGKSGAGLGLVAGVILGIGLTSMAYR